MRPLDAVLNVLWLLFSGIELAIVYALTGLVMLLLIVTIPFGVAALRLAGYVLWPFGRTVVHRPDAGAPSAIANVLWFLLAGLWLAITHFILGILLCLTIIGIPFGVANFKLASAALAPLGKEVIRTDDPRLARLP